MKIIGEENKSLSSYWVHSVFQLDADGSANGAVWTTIVAFYATTVGQFAAANFSGYDASGSAAVLQTITGASGDDTLTGTPGRDTIFRLASNDGIEGSIGNDTIHAGQATPR